MCDLCSTDLTKRAIAREGMRSRANDLERLAKMFKSLASGEMKPHDETGDAGKVRMAARRVIRFLVEDWL